MTGRQRGLVALIVAILVVVVGLGGFLAWAAFNHAKEEKAASKPALQLQLPLVARLASLARVVRGLHLPR